MAKKNEAPKKAAPKKTEPIELTKDVLLAAAKDINAADIADPAIDIKGSESQLKKALKAAAEIVEPEDELKPETFAVLKAVAEEGPEDEDEDGEDAADADEDKDEEVEDDETEADESNLEDLTVEKLQAKCKAAGIPFKAKKTTKSQLIAALEAHEAKQDEVEVEDDDGDKDEDEKDVPAPEPKAKPEKKAVQSKLASPVKAEKKTGGEKKEESFQEMAARFIKDGTSEKNQLKEFLAAYKKKGNTDEKFVQKRLSIYMNIAKKTTS